MFCHGVGWSFMINGFHELVHDSVFKTRRLNRVFLRVFSFLGQFNHHHFWASHMEHHKYTLHPPDDLEVVLPQVHTLRGFSRAAVINPTEFWATLKQHVRWSRGVFRGKWESHLFPPEALAERRALVNWSRTALVGHALIVAVSIWMHWWMVPVVITLAPYYRGFIHYLCNSSQHVGL